MTSNLLKADSARDSPSPERKEDTPSLDSSPSITRRISYQMVGGIHIPNEEGVRWYERKYGRELPKDHRGDMSVRMELERILTEEEGEPSASNMHRVVMPLVFLPEQQMKGESAREDQMPRDLAKFGFVVPCQIEQMLVARVILISVSKRQAMLSVSPYGCASLKKGKDTYLILYLQYDGGGIVRIPNSQTPEGRVFAIVYRRKEGKTC
ncbi:hypothetical protein B0H13DRAFT_1876066 [Mycena leptocephala]|nr:hypothetical protein B0H13DRAFT_1876066 [Mycena leptocephala]